MANTGRYVPAEREQAFLDTIENPKYDREITNGLKPFFEDKAPDDIKNFYSPDELSVLLSIKGTERDVENRRPRRRLVVPGHGGRPHLPDHSRADG